MSNNQAPSGDEPSQTVNRLQDRAAFLSEQDLADIVERFGDHEGVARALIARDDLTAKVLLMLVERLSPALYDDLATRHGLPEAQTGELQKRSTTRPRWWSDHMMSLAR